MNLQANTKPKQGSDADTDTIGEDSTPTMRIDSLGAGGMESLTDAPKKRVPVQLIMLAGLVLVAGSALFVMRKLGMGPAGAIADINIDYDTKNAPSTKDHQKVLQDLAASHVEQQVPTEQVQRNPFRLPDSLRKADEPVLPTPGGGLTAEQKKAQELEAARLQALEQRRADIEAALYSFQVHSILGGSSPLARINDKTVRVGDKLGDFFTVTAIHGRTVEVQADGQKHELSMDAEDMPGVKTTPAPSPKPANAGGPTRK